MSGYSASNMFDNMRRLTILNGNTGDIYALRRNDIKKLSAKDWTPLYDHAYDKAHTLLTSEFVKALIRGSSIWERMRNEVHSNLLKLVGCVDQLRDRVREKDSEIIRFLDAISGHKDAGERNTHIYQWASDWFGIPLTDDEDKLPREIKDAKRIAEKYNMIQHLSFGYGSPTGHLLQDIAQYIDAVDVSHMFLMLSKGDDSDQE